MENISAAVKKNNYWFPSKKYGIGWGLPVTWQGWGVLISYLLLAVLGAIFLTHPPFMIPLFIIYIFIITGILLWVCWKKGDNADLN